MSDEVHPLHVQCPECLRPVGLVCRNNERYPGLGFDDRPVIRNGLKFHVERIFRAKEQRLLNAAREWRARTDIDDAHIAADHMADLIVHLYGGGK